MILTDGLSDKTLAEMAAGRRAIEDKFRSAVVENGLAVLKQRFGDRQIVTAGSAWRNERFEIDVIVHTADGRMMQLTDPTVRGFPSDHLIAQIALVV